MTSATLTDIVIVLAVAVAITLVFGRLRLPTLVGLFVAGVLAGPNALGLVNSTGEVEALAEVGVVHGTDRTGVLTRVPVEAATLADSRTTDRPGQSGRPF